MSLEQLLEKIPRGSPDEALAREVNFDALPSHIAIIMDGNGRWAAQRHLPRVEGHRAGIDSVRDVVEASARLGIDVLTLYAFSVENWQRPRGNRRRGAARDRVRHGGRGSRRAALRRVPLHRGTAGSRLADSHERRD